VGLTLVGCGVEVSAGQAADERAGLVERLHGFGQERPEKMEVMGGHRLNGDRSVDAAFLAVLGEQLSFLKHRVARGGMDEQRRLRIWRLSARAG